MSLEGPDRSIGWIASAQHGVVARRQLLAAGIGRRAIEHRLKQGRLRPVFRGVYAVGHTALGFTGRLAAALLAVSSRPGRPSIAASHWSAAALWGLVEPGAHALHVSAASQRRGTDGLIVHWADLPAEEVRCRSRLPLTAVPRTLLDLSAITKPRQLRRLVREAEYRRLTTMRALDSLLRRHPYRHGRRALAEIVTEALATPGRTRSELEDLFLAFCRRHGLPRPETNLLVEVGGVRFELDCAWRPQLVALELDGYEGHRGRIAFEDDRARDRRLAAAGWTPVRLTWGQLLDGDATLAREISAILAAKRTRT